MKIKMFCVLDSKIGAFGQPFFADTEAAAIRAFGDWVQDDRTPNNMLNKHPEDFSLHSIGEFDRLTAVFEREAHTRCLVTASALMSFKVDGRVEQLELPESVQ